MTAAPMSSPYGRGGVPARPLTLDDVTQLAESDDVHRFELVDGNLVTVSPATGRHQLTTARLVAWLINHGYVDRVLPDTGVRTSDDNRNGRVPDLVVLTTAYVGDDTVWHAAGAVLLAVEIVSRGSERTDRWFKPLEYARVGIPHFWRVEPDDTVVQFRLADGSYVEHSRVPLAKLLASTTVDLA